MSETVRHDPARFAEAVQVRFGNGEWSARGSERLPAVLSRDLGGLIADNFGDVMKAQYLAADMAERGWQGAPVLFYRHQDKDVVVDGNYRLLAAQAAGVGVRAVEIDNPWIISSLRADPKSLGINRAEKRGQVVGGKPYDVDDWNIRIFAGSEYASIASRAVNERIDGALKDLIESPAGWQAEFGGLFSGGEKALACWNNLTGGSGVFLVSGESLYEVLDGEFADGGVAARVVCSESGALRRHVGSLFRLSGTELDKGGVVKFKFTPDGGAYPYWNDGQVRVVDLDEARERYRTNAALCDMPALAYAEKVGMDAPRGLSF